MCDLVWARNVKQSHRLDKFVWTLMDGLLSTSSQGPFKHEFFILSYWHTRQEAFYHNLATCHMVLEISLVSSFGFFKPAWLLKDWCWICRYMKVTIKESFDTCFCRSDEQPGVSQNNCWTDSKMRLTLVQRSLHCPGLSPCVPVSCTSTCLSSGKDICILRGNIDIWWYGWTIGHHVAF